MHRNVMGTMLARLDVETRAYHGGADSVWRSLMEGTATPATYMHQLSRVYGFEAPLEAALAYTPGLSSVIDIRGRVRSGLIVRDLLALGISAAKITELPQCMIAPFATEAEALGWLYVVERAALLHEPVRRYLVARFPQLMGATSYLAAATEVRWIDYADTLEPYVQTRALQQQVVSGARDGFRCALEWFRTGHTWPVARDLTVLRA
jgi:heme oxygenase